MAYILRRKILPGKQCKIAIELIKNGLAKLGLFKKEVRNWRNHHILEVLTAVC